MCCHKVYWLKPGYKPSLASNLSSSTYVCAILNKLIDLSKSQFYYLENEDYSRGWYRAFVRISQDDTFKEFCTMPGTR